MIEQVWCGGIQCIHEEGLHLIDWEMLAPP